MYARRVLGDRSDTAEDVVQEAYLRLLSLAASDEAPTSARPWLFRVVRNLAIDERRSVARRADPVADTAILGTAALDDTAELVEQREEIADALRDIASLPPRERRAIEMDQAGIGAQAIATELGTTPNAVHQALFRARKRLRNGRAVVWGLIPVGLAPLALRLSDPAVAVTMTNLPPGAPIGRALPVAGIVAAAMVSGSVVAPSVDPNPNPARSITFVKPAKAATTDTPAPPTRSVSSAQRASTTTAAPSTTKPKPASNSGKGKSGSSDDEGDDRDSGKTRSRNRGSGGGDDDGNESGKTRSRNRGSGGGDGGGERDSGKTRRGKGSGKSPSTSGGGNDDSNSSGSDRSGSGSGSGSDDGGDDSSNTPTTPDEPKSDDE